MKPPRYHFRIIGLFQLGSTGVPIEYPLNCWGVTLDLFGPDAGNGVLIDGQDIDENSQSGTGVQGVVRFRWGFVPVLPGGVIVNIDQTLTFSVRNEAARGFLTLHYLEP